MQFIQAYSTVGTPDYIAPEVLLKKGYGMECDWLVSLFHSLSFSLFHVPNTNFSFIISLGGLLVQLCMKCLWAIRHFTRMILCQHVERLIHICDLILCGLIL